MQDGVGDAIINAAKKKRREVGDRILENKRNGKSDGKRVMRQNEILDVEVKLYSTPCAIVGV